MKISIVTWIVTITILWQGVVLADSTWNQTATGTYAWNVATNWMPTNFPNATGAVANVNNDIAAAQTIQMRAAITVGTLNVGDSGAPFFPLAINPSAGSLILNNGGSTATITKTPADTNVDTMLTTILLNDHVDIVNNASGALNISGAISDGGAGRRLTKLGSGVLILSGRNTFNGGVLLNAGTLDLQDITALGAPSSMLTISAGTLIDNSGSALVMTNNNPQAWNGDFTFVGTKDLSLGAGPVTLNANCQVTTSHALGQNVGTLTIGGPIADGGNLYRITKSGDGALTLGGSNTFGGGVTLSSGTLNINSPTALGAASGAFAITAGASFDNASAGDITLASSNPMIWNGDFMFKGTRNLNMGQGAVTLNADCQASVNNGKTLSVGGVISGPYRLTVTRTANSGGAGGLTLSGDNTHRGTTVVDGTLNINHPRALGAAGYAFIMTNVTGTTTGITIDNTSTGAITLVDNPVQNWYVDFAFGGSQDLDLGTGAVTVGKGPTENVTVNARTLAIGGTVGGGASLKKLGAGTLALRGNLTFSNDLIVAAGTTIVTGTNLYRGTTQVDGGVLNFNSIGNVNGGSSALGAPLTVANGTISIGSTTNAGILVYTNGSGHTSDRVINLNGTTGGATIEASGTGPLVFAGGVTATGKGAKTLTLSGVNAGTLGGSIPDYNVTNKTSLTKTGPGQWTLNGSNLYSGATLIDNGMLVVNGSVGGNSAVTVTNRGILAGTGVVAGVVSVRSGGQVSPGGSNAVGTLIAGSNVWSSGGSYTWTLSNAVGAAGIGYDRLAIVGGTLDVQATETAPFTINVVSPPGGAVNFTNSDRYSWVLATSAVAIAHFGTNTVNVNASSFLNAAQGHTFTVRLAPDSNSVQMVYATGTFPTRVIIR